jgi:hypothetical protein
VRGCVDAEISVDIFESPAPQADLNESRWPHLAGAPVCPRGLDRSGNTVHALVQLEQIWGTNVQPVAAGGKSTVANSTI